MSVSQITAPDLDEDEARDLALMLTQLDVRQVANRKRIVYFNREKRVRKLGFSVPRSCGVWLRFWDGRKRP